MFLQELECLDPFGEYDKAVQLILAGPSKAFVFVPDDLQEPLVLGERLDTNHFNRICQLLQQSDIVIKSRVPGCFESAYTIPNGIETGRRA